MEKVYVVWVGEYEDCDIDRVYTDRILAELWAEKIGGTVQEFDVDLTVFPGNLTEED